MGKIWSGFDTTPPTLPKACVVCLGCVGGDFIRLGCSHGGADCSPIHVSCLVRNFAVSDPTNPQLPWCPVCRTQIDSDTLSQLAGYVRQHRCVKFPGDAGTDEEVHTSDVEREKLLKFIVDAEERCLGHDIEPTPDENRRQYYDDLMSRAESLAGTLRKGVEEGTLTREDMDQGLRDLGEVEQRLSVCAGRVALLDHLDWAIQGSSLSEIHDQLVRVRQEIEDVRHSVRKQRERFEHEREAVGS